MFYLVSEYDRILYYSKHNSTISVDNVTLLLFITHTHTHQNHHWNTLFIPEEIMFATRHHICIVNDMKMRRAL